MKNVNNTSEAVELLLKECNEIKPKEMDCFEKDLRFACKKRGYQDTYTEAILSHRYRYFLTIEKIKEINQKKSPIKQGLEMGGDGPFTDLLKKSFPQISWNFTKGDLRYDWGIEENSLDFVLSTEVVEHLSDIPQGFQDTFYYSGLTSTLKESYKALKKGGYLFITTPNASSINIVMNALAGESPWFFPPHVREYTMKDLQNRLIEQGFDIVSAETVHCMTYPLNIDWGVAFQSILASGYSCTNRGDDIFIICRK